jgi:hypothetical protein
MMWSDLLDATGQRAKSKALDTAGRYYIQMAGGTTAVPNGAVDELLTRATEQGSVTAAEIAEILHTDELPVTYTESFATGTDVAGDADGGA